MTYQPSTREQRIDILDLEQLAAEAAQLIPKEGYDYIREGAGDESTLRENLASFTRRQIVPRVCSGKSEQDISTTFLGMKVKTPLMVSPAAAHILANVQGKLASAAAAAASGAIFGYSTFAAKTMADIAAAGNGGAQIFQLYISGNDNLNHYLLDEAQRCGVRAVTVTLDTTVEGYRKPDIVNHFQFPFPSANLVRYGEVSGEKIDDLYVSFARNITFDTVRDIRRRLSVPLIAKGVQSPLDVDGLIEAGVDAIQVSNHGGRQLGEAPGSFTVLPEIVEAIGGRVPVIFDSGVRGGEHMFKALASGVDLVAFARPVFYALALGGRQGVEDLFAFMNDSLIRTMQLAGCGDLADIRKAGLRG